MRNWHRPPKELKAHRFNDLLDAIELILPESELENGETTSGR
jgi:hypothetical protein